MDHEEMEFQTFLERDKAEAEKASRIKIGIREATQFVDHPAVGKLESVDDFRTIMHLQFRAFRSNFPASVLSQVMDGCGVAYLAIDEDQPDLKIGYAVLVSKKLDNNKIQRELNEKDKHISEGVDMWFDHSYYHDHESSGYTKEMIDIHDIGIDPVFQGKGYGAEFLRLVKRTYETKFGESKWKALVRINNVPSLGLLTSVLKMSCSRLQGLQTEKEHGSEETNFWLDTEIPPVDELPQNLKTKDVWNIGDSLPAAEFFLLPMPEGEQSRTRYIKQTIDMLRQVMAVGRDPILGKDYVMRRVCRGEELQDLGIDVNPAISYLFFTREWEHKLD